MQKIFVELFGKYTRDILLIQRLWLEVEAAYSGGGRFYHTLSHIEAVLEALRPHVPLIKDYDTLLFSVVYHDVIYNAEERNNEERSAELAEQRMQEINVPLDKIINCRRQIIATKSHTQSADMDTNFLLDADLSILGKSWEEYVTYTTNIRREYAIYPDVIYNAGRKSVLKHFLQMDRIFKTKEFYERFEKDARDNIEREIAML